MWYFFSLAQLIRDEEIWVVVVLIFLQFLQREREGEKKTSRYESFQGNIDRSETVSIEKGDFLLFTTITLQY